MHYIILATNELNKTRLSSSDMLLEYKQQSQVESGFKFIKGNTFQVSSIFLKKPERIDALMMVMVLSLMVYGLGEFWLRESLKKHNETVPNQLKKPTDKPTMAWIARLFQGVQVLTISFDERHQQELVSNLNAVTKRIIRHFGSEAMKIYGLAEA
jgi:transposase